MNEQEWEEFKTGFKRDVMEARALIECVQLYGVPANCDHVKMVKDVEAYRKAWEGMAETLEKAGLKSMASLARATVASFKSRRTKSALQREDRHG